MSRASQRRSSEMAACRPPTVSGVFSHGSVSNRDPHESQDGGLARTVWTWRGAHTATHGQGTPRAGTKRGVLIVGREEFKGYCQAGSAGVS